MKQSIPALYSAKKSLQQFADENIKPELRQNLKSAAEIAVAIGWGDPDKPVCCGQPVNVQSMIGSPYFAECEKCGKWAAAVDGPMFSNGGGVVQFLDPDKVDLDTDRRWIAGNGAPRE